jgi:hypothetical protein
MAEAEGEGGSRIRWHRGGEERECGSRIRWQRRRGGGRAELDGTGVERRGSVGAGLDGRIR